MKKIIALSLFYFLKIVLWFRYRVTVKGLDNLNSQTLSKPGGVLFLPNHPAAFVDPTLISLAVARRYPTRPLIVEYMYYTPGIHTIMRFINALPIPTFNVSSNSLKRRKSEKAILELIQDLRKGENFLIYPSGFLKNTPQEIIGGASGVHRILQDAPEANIVLVRIKGLWGSSFSKAFTGKVPPIFPTILKGLKIAFKNLLFFTPRRQVIIEFEPAPPDFPYNATRLELNRYLENWYNKPDGLMPQTEELPGDSLMLVPYSMWSKKAPEIKKERKEEEEIRLSAIPLEIQEKVIDKLAQLTDRDAEQIKSEMNLSTDLGLDSLDIADLAVFLHDDFDIAGVPTGELTTVSKLMGIASRQVNYQEETEEDHLDLSKWNKKLSKYRLTIAPGETIPEVFLNNCKRMGNAMACGDMRAGVVTYAGAKTRCILLAEYIRKMPGDNIGILLPASVAAFITVLACQLAGKIPVMVNWTVGPRHLESVRSLSKLQVVLTSWTFLDRLQNVELDGIEDQLIMLEDIRREFSLKDKLKALILSKRGTQEILKHFNNQLKAEDQAVLLFTSGTESLPKGVPLSHFNILSNHRAGLEAIEAFSNDVFYGILPPFHAFGFTMTGFLALLSGMKIAFAPDPRDGKKLAKGCEKWGVTILCGAPTFLRALLKAATQEQLRTLRLCVSGAEKAPPELFELMKRLGKENLLYEGYGITECSPVLTMNRLGKKANGVGEPLPGVELIIVHPETFVVLTTNQQGLILARGPNIFSGYLNKGITSPFVTVGDKSWYNTGDLGYLDEEGRLVISGRMKRFIKIGGEMISLTAVEDALLHAALQKDWPISDEGPSLAICAKEEPGEKTKIFLFTKFAVELDEVNKLLKQAGFSNLVRISVIVQLPTLPIMGTGKTNYRELEAKYISKHVEVANK